MNRFIGRRALSLSLAIAALAIACGRKDDKAPGEPSTGRAAAASVELLNVSYDPTRELYDEINAAFAKGYEAKTGTKVTIKQSHGGSAKQARAVIDGLEADVVTLGLAYDIDALAGAGLVAKDWPSRLPNGATPFTSTIVFLVRSGNPKGIHDWGDLVKPGVAVITPNPKTSGGARWNYLAAWGYARKQPNGDDEKARAFVERLYANVPVLDTGARGATTTFVERKIGDVLIAWEDEALLARKKLGDAVEIVYPPLSIVAATPVAIVDKVVDKKGTRTVAQAYLEYLFTPEAQNIAVKHFYRPAISPAPEGAFAPIERFAIDDVFGGWQKAHATHFADGATFDRLIAKGK